MPDQKPTKARGAILDVSGEATCASIAERLQSGRRIPVIIHGFIEGPHSDFGLLFADDEEGMQSFNLEDVTFQEVTVSEQPT